MLNTNTILPVIVLYNSFVYNSSSYNYLVNELSNGKIRDILIYDNSTKSSYLQENAKAKGSYVSFNENSGLSMAYNYAANFAKENGYKWILLLDQDTNLPDEFIDRYILAMNQNPEVMMFIPQVYTTNGNLFSPLKMRHYIPIKKSPAIYGIINPKYYSIINSGILINVEAFYKAGGYNADVKVDFADYQFIDRFSAKYDKVFVLNTICKQPFSNETQSKDQKLNRFILFCESLKKYEVKFPKKIFIHMVVFKRMLSLMHSLKSIKPLPIFIKNYVI